MRADCLPRASVAIHVNGSALHEYEAESEDAMTALSYVETVNGAEFAVVLVVEHGFAYRDDHLQFSVYLDGHRVESYTLGLAEKGGAFTKRVDRVQEYSDGFRSSRKFMFAQHETTDGKADPSHIRKLSKIGEVTVKLTRCRESHREHSSETVYKFEALGEDGIPEKALKGQAISCHAKLGEVQRKKREVNTRVHVTYPFGREPLTTYTFRYRSRDDLQAEGLIERSPSPIPLEDRDLADLKPEDALELVRRMRARDEVTVKVKKEKQAKRQRSVTLGGEEEEEGDVTITSIDTPRSKRARVTRLSKDDVIDLTDD